MEQDKHKKKTGNEGDSLRKKGFPLGRLLFGFLKMLTLHLQ